ncbi:MAG: 23S rRNA (guanosine(2251)-2'-O)-methyltransferase RlmB [Clostridiales bacterium]|jgi:23S rRNA (guanosine2251-2'-O)-methyltransferase|nr:23S rRNA (guanosine(2251)-2'-O)-methyltransferase RlmB [Clostridiales bacterium]HOB63850.1 23S rRNA (guanosine(2251)-2'-O)-methyltransferase RlmB [Clostridia bacterium]HOK82127.1 23S rRNA (guanosine(2251)-2'-O)-methyltransferase RlmB [Clostridia bacterium]HOL61067.1 23S rRNA (guanosine(2251)-2'-O)-methyltransferase RlmB [Clostridia bacterium]HPO53979.1 23S rRNA (guanosine(2251)-2'-O)-methyltransferase RlmB [Clostridia bacterium]
MIIEGINAVGEALGGGLTVEKLYIQKGAFSDRLNRLVAEARKQNIRVQFTDKEALDRMSEAKRHQGAIAVVTEFVYANFDALTEAACSDKAPVLFVLLEGVEDPHNLGAVIRVADCAGATGVVIPKHRNATVNETAIRTSAGAAAYVPIAKVTNINDAVRKLKDMGVTVYAADMDGASVYETDLTGNVAIVIGGEGKGVNALTKKLADGVISLPQLGKVNSLNASVACGALLYEAVRQRQQK